LIFLNRTGLRIVCCVLVKVPMPPEGRNAFMRRRKNLRK
jgi:hypothetical protein